MKAYSGKIFSISTLSPCSPRKLPTPPELNLIVLAFPLPGFAVFGEAFQELAEVATFGAEPVEGGAVDFGVGVGEGERRDCGVLYVNDVFSASNVWIMISQNGFGYNT